MSNQENTASESTDTRPNLGEQGVADYLRQHPAFFEDKPTLLADLRVPHTAGSAVSLVERQVSVLRESNASLQEELESLLQVARDNDKLNSLLHTFTLRIIESESLDALLQLIDKQLRQDFSADMVAVRLLACTEDSALFSRDEFPEDADALCGLFRRLLSSGKPHCGQLSSEQLTALFGDQGESVASSALLSLGSRGEFGLLVIGSVERDRYHAGIDTAFLNNLSEVVSTAVGKHLDAI